MSTKKEIVDMLTADNIKDFETLDYGVEGIVAQYLPSKDNNKATWCLWLKGAKGKGTRIFTEEQALLYGLGLTDAKTVRLIKIIAEINPERTDVSKNNGLRKIPM